MRGQTITQHLNEGAELSKAEPARTAAREIMKMIKRCKAETKAINW